TGAIGFGPRLEVTASGGSACLGHLCMVLAFVYQCKYDSGMPTHALEEGFGARLRLLRLRRGLSQRDLARRARLGEITVIRLEAETNMPRPGTVRALARALDVKPLELTTDMVS